MAFNADLPFELDVERLSGWSGSRSDIYTAFVSYVMCKDFRISVHGQRNVNNAFNNLPLHETPDERLSFGWALKSPIRSRKVHEGAYEHIATMVALSETFHESYAARVMYEMAQTRAQRTDTTPHFSQWKALVHQGNGAFAMTDFGLIVEDFIRMDPFNVTWKSDDSLMKMPIHPKTVANTLTQLTQLTRGEVQKLTIVGSAVISWLAGISVWLYDLRIAIFSSAGVQLHVSHPDQETQALFIFDEKPGITVSTKPWTKDHLQVEETKPDGVATYAISIHTTPFSGRVVWQSLLPRVFGRSFHHLDHEESKTLGTMLGSAAKMFQGLALGEAKDTYPDLLSEQNRTNTSSFGPGLVETLTNWLPELRRFQGKMERALKASYQDASKSYVEQLSRLRSVCHCDICSSKQDEGAPTVKAPPEHGYCLTTLAETILALGLALSRITVSAGTHPSRAGIQSFYASQVAKRLEARGRHWTEHFTIVYGNEWNAPDARRLQNCVQIFSGSRPQADVPENLVAISHEGICAYFVNLERSGTKHHQEAVKLVRITSGGINVLHKVFSRACLGPVKDEDPQDPWEEVQTDHLPQPLYCK